MMHILARSLLSTELLVSRYIKRAPFFTRPKNFIPKYKHIDNREEKQYENTKISNVNSNLCYVGNIRMLSGQI